MILAFSHVITALDVTPAAMRQKTTMVLRFINEQGRELDRVVARIRAARHWVGVPRHACAPWVARVPHRGGSTATGRPGFRVDGPLYQLLQGRWATDLVSILVGAGATSTGVAWEVDAAGDATES
jgi:hypothetical protein